MLNGTTALVTGAARGIGKAIAERFVSEGCYVYLADLELNSLNSAQGQIDPEKTNTRTIVCNVAIPDSVEHMIKTVKSERGGLDILVNNAGITRDNLFLRMKNDEWQQVIDVNLSGVFFCSRYAAMLLRKSKRGRIINLSSVSAKGNAGQANYSASKAGIIGLTKTLALELARYKVTVNAIAPGFIDTEMTQAIPDKARDEWLANIPAKRPGKPEDIASSVAFLCSEDASYITGQILGVDGGLGI